jgi:CBS domain-containing protein
MVARRRPVCIDLEATIAAASRMMRDKRVDELVVTEKLHGKAIPAGIVSARDILTRVVAAGLDPKVMTVGDILWTRPTAAQLSDSVPDTLERLCAAGSEMLPIVDSDGRAAGVVWLEDLLQALAGIDDSRTHRIHRR